MKNTILLFLLISFYSYSQTETLTDSVITIKNVDMSKFTKKDFKRCTMEHDAFDDVTTIKSSRLYFVPILDIHLIIKNNILIPYLQISYKGDEWLFIDNFDIKYDDKRYSFSLNNTNRKIVTGSTILEKNFLPINEEILKVLEAVSNAKSVEYRFYGENGTITKKFNRYDKKGLESMLNAYRKVVPN